MIAFNNEISSIGSGFSPKRVALLGESPPNSGGFAEENEATEGDWVSGSMFRVIGSDT